MKNKAITIVCSVLMILAIICVGYIVINSISKSKDNDVPKPIDEVTEPVDNEITQREERGQNVNVNSRIGVQLKELIKYSEIYSEGIINELDSNGVSSKAKLLISLNKIHTSEEYKSYIEYSEEYNSSYILEGNMNEVLAAIFSDSNVDDKNVDDILTYDNTTNAYVINSRGMGSGSIGYAVEVPYKITEYTDRVELLAYRVYVNKKIEMKEIETSVVIDLFYDKAKSINALTIENDADFNEYNQVDYIESKIQSGAIVSNNLESVKYIFNKVDGGYRIASFGKM